MTGPSAMHIFIGKSWGEAMIYDIVLCFAEKENYKSLTL